MKTIEINYNEIKSVKKYLNDAVNLTNKAIALLNGKEDTITMDYIKRIIHTELCDTAHNNALYNIFDNMWIDEELSKELDFDTLHLYNRMAYNKVKYLYEVRELFKRVNNLTIIALNYITITNNEAVLIPDFESKITSDYTTECKTSKQEQITKIFDIIIKNLDSLKRYDINHYEVLGNIYLNDDKLNINSNFILSK